jgi:uncharacterized membrane protein (DUF373 family)
MRDKNAILNQWLTKMEWLDRWGYVTAGLSLLVLGMLIFAHSWVNFVVSLEHTNLLTAGLKLLNDILLVIILLELFRTVVRFLQTDQLLLEPYLAVGIIACTRRVLTSSAEFAHDPGITEALFMRYLWDIGLNVSVIMILILGIFVLRQRQEPPPPPPRSNATL